MALLWQDSPIPQGWSDSAIRDTIAAIARDPAYQRDIGQSIMGRAMRWFWMQVDRLMDAIHGLPHGRAIALAVVALLVSLIVARVLIGVRAEQRMRGRSARTHLQLSRNVSLSDAERLAQEGNYTAAAHTLFASLLLAGGARGEFKVHPSKTTGDYARELRRRQGPWLRPFQSFRSRYDRVIYGDRRCTVDDYQALERDARVMLTPQRAA